MPNTFIGLIILVAFLIPGFLAIIVVRRRVPLFAARQSQLEIVLWGCSLSLISHILLFLIGCLIAALVCIFWCEARETICQLLNLKLSEISQKLDNIKIWQLLLFSFSYFIVDSALAIFLGIRFSQIINKNPNFLPDLCSVWISAFPEDKVTFAKALLDNDYSVTGIAQWTQTDPESLISGNRDILFVSPAIIDKEGNIKEQIAEGVLINTRNIKILELKTEELNKLLFSVGLEYQTDLDKNNISDNLQQEFKDNKNLLSQNVTVSIEEKYSKWLIIDKDNKKTYSVRKEKDKLNIYQNNEGGKISWLKRIMKRNKM